MKTLRTPYVIALSLTIALVALHHFGRPLWEPLMLRMIGARTVQDVLRQFEPSVKERVTDLDALTDGSPITLVAFKEERRLELWKRGKLMREYPFSGFSGRIGPKLREGDAQIPEGIYRIDSLNPNSYYHLSLRLDYPNEFDRLKAKLDGRRRLGGEIFIHGMSSTVGCIPLGNSNIEELFVIIAKNGYSTTRVIISPYDMRRGQKELSIPGINWAPELYATIAEQLRKHQTTTQPKP